MGQRRGRGCVRSKDAVDRIIRTERLLGVDLGLLCHPRGRLSVRGGLGGFRFLKFAPSTLKLGSLFRTRFWLGTLRNRHAATEVRDESRFGCWLYHNHIQWGKAQFVQDSRGLFYSVRGQNFLDPSRHSPRIGVRTERKRQFACEGRPGDVGTAANKVKNALLGLELRRKTLGIAGQSSIERFQRILDLQSINGLESKDVQEGQPWRTVRGVSRLSTRANCCRRSRSRVAMSSSSAALVHSTRWV